MLVIATGAILYPLTKIRSRNIHKYFPQPPGANRVNITITTNANDTTFSNLPEAEHFNIFVTAVTKIVGTIGATHESNPATIKVVTLPGIVFLIVIGDW